MLNVRLADDHLMGNSSSPGCRWSCLWWRLFVLSFFPRNVLDEIWDLIELISEGFLTYSSIQPVEKIKYDDTSSSRFKIIKWLENELK